MRRNCVWICIRFEIEDGNSIIFGDEIVELLIIGDIFSISFHLNSLNMISII